MFGRGLSRYRAYGQSFGLSGYWAPNNEQGNILHLGLSYINTVEDLAVVFLIAAHHVDAVGGHDVATCVAGYRVAVRERQGRDRTHPRHRVGCLLGGVRGVADHPYGGNGDHRGDQQHGQRSRPPCAS